MLSKTDERFQHLIGERVEIRDEDGMQRVGILQFAGINNKAHGKFQVTIDRCPIWPVDPDTIKLWSVKEKWEWKR